MNDNNQWEDVNRSTLVRRAADLAQPLELQRDIGETSPLLEVLLLGGLRYGVDLTTVEAVARIGDIVSIPLTPKHITGIIRRHGIVYALVSLKHYFYPQIEGIADADFAVIVKVQGILFALQAEEILGVFHREKSEIQPVPENFDGAQAPFIRGVTTDGLSVIDLERLVDAPGFRAGGSSN